MSPEEQAEFETLLGLASKIAQSEGNVDPQAKYRVMIRLIALDEELLSRLSLPTRHRLLAAAAELGILKGEHD